MAGSIVIFFYGVPLVNAQYGRTREIEDLIEAKPNGVFTYYNSFGNYMETAGFGIPLCQMYETDHHGEVTQYVAGPTVEQIGEYKKLYGALTSEHKSAVDECGIPRTIVLWASK